MSSRLPVLKYVVVVRSRLPVLKYVGVVSLQIPVLKYDVVVSLRLPVSRYVVVVNSKYQNQYMLLVLWSLKYWFQSMISFILLLLLLL